MNKLVCLLVSYYKCINCDMERDLWIVTKLRQFDSILFLFLSLHFFFFFLQRAQICL